MTSSPVALKEESQQVQQAPRVLFLESATGPGGSVHFVCDLARHVNRDRISLIIGLYGPNPSRSLAEMDALNVPVVVFGGGRPAPASNTGPISRLFDTKLRRIRLLRTAVRVAAQALTYQLPLAWRMRNYIRQEKVQLVVLNQDVHFHTPGVLAAKWAGVPCICRKAGGIGQALRLKRFLNRWVDLFISISKATDDDQRVTPGTKKLILLHEGVDLTRFASLPSRSTMRQRLGLPAGKKVVASISRIEEGKGHREFIRMVPLVLQRYRDVVFVIVGGRVPDDLPLLNELKAMVHSLNLDDHFVFTGWRDDIPAIMTAIDLFVHCPTTFIEGMGMTCFEAMAAGVPAVISDNGGLRDAVLDGESGFIVPRGDVDRMADAVVTLLTDEERARAYGRRAREFVEEEFDVARNGRALQELLLEYVPGKQPSR